MKLTVTGLDDVMKKLHDMPSMLVHNALGTALDRAGGVIAGTIMDQAPEREFGLLKRNCGVKVTLDSQGRGGIADIAYGEELGELSKKPAWLIAMWVERGHQGGTPAGSEQYRDKKGKLRTKKKFNRARNTPAHPFIRPAVYAAEDRAQEVFREVIDEEIDKWGDL